LKCPLDKSDMIVVEHKKIELDYCLRCAGVWFDAGELDLLISTIASEDKNQPSNDILSFTPASVKEAKRHCPICGKNMDKIWLGKEPKILIDHCPRGHGLWFDGGELRQFLQQALPGEAKGVIAFLGDTFYSLQPPAGFPGSEKQT
jgi:Zn-finger nucleic acid-binding protein